MREFAALGDSITVRRAPIGIRRSNQESTADEGETIERERERESSSALVTRSQFAVGR